MEEDDGEGLLSQEYIRDSRKTIRDLIKETIAQVRENIQVSRFMRFEVGMSGVGPTDGDAEPAQK
jgi:elongation factor Ts